MRVIEKVVLNDCFGFLRKILMPKTVNRPLLGPKLTFLKFSQNVFSRFFWNCIRWQVFKVGKTEYSCDWKENSFYAQNWENVSFLSPKLTFLNFSQILIIRFFWKCTWWKALGKSDYSCDWKENSFYAQNGENGWFLDRKIIRSFGSLDYDRHQE